MRQRPFSFCFTFLVFGCILTVATAQEDASPKHELPTIEEKTKGMHKHQGFLPFYWDEQTGSILLEIDRWDKDLLYIHSLATGLGSNPVGLDRGQMGSEKVVRFHRVGPKVLLIHRNLRFRANTENRLERKAVEESFAESVIWGSKVVAESGGTALVDASRLLFNDSHDVIQVLAASEQGDFTLDETRSAVYLPHCKSFPKNTELEVLLTFAGQRPGNYVQQTTPTPTAVSLRTHHSFVQLPDEGYVPRNYDVRSPCLFVNHADYAAPLDAPLQKRWIIRHRLQKKDADAEISEPIKPIVYYVDPGAPAPIQQALIEGAQWWDDAFEAAGFKHAFQVRVLPPDAHPLDIRYNVIQWVHRSTRGWSYGRSVVDPRTGEIMKGHVTLGSLRVRQDQLLFNGLQPTSAAARCACCGIGGVAEDTSLADLDGKTTAVEVALARIRQLSAHEVGHTLGFVHNFAGSTYGDRASVMDYPAPRVSIANDEQLDLSDAYGIGIGSWDKLSVQFAYGEFAPHDEKRALDDLLSKAHADGMVFISDADARPAGAAHPLGNLWDNGSNPLEQLRHVMRVREIAMRGFDPQRLPAGTTTADIGQYLTPLYLHHRYQLQAVGKYIGGYEYAYGYADQGASKEMVPAEIQQQAIDSLISTIDPQQLAISDRIVSAIAPRPYATIRDNETLPTNTGRVFDPLAAAAIAADLTLSELLQHQRLASLTLHAQRTPTLAPVVVVPEIVEKIWRVCEPVANTERAAIGRVVRARLLEKLIQLVDTPSSSADVRSAALLGIERFIDPPGKSAEEQEAAFRRQLQRRARQILERPYTTPPERKSLSVPPGSPIGADLGR